MAFEFRRAGAAIVLGGLAMSGLAGCMAAPVPDGVNAGVDRASPYPDITARVHAATTQMSNDEAASISARLSALGAQRQAGSISEAEYQRQVRELQALAANHGAETLKAIEN